MKCTFLGCKNDAEVQGGDFDFCMRHFQMMVGAHVVEIFHYNESRFEFDAVFNGGADYPKYFTVVKLFRSKKEADEYARTLTPRVQPEPSGIDRIIVRPLQFDDVLE